MLRNKINTIALAMVALFSADNVNAINPWSPAPCKSIVQGSKTITKVTKIGTMHFDPLGTTTMMEVSGKNSAGEPMSIRFKVIPKLCTDCTALEISLTEASTICMDNARLALALKQPLQFVEMAAGGMCDVSAAGSNLKEYEIRSMADTNVLLPTGSCAVGSLPGVQQFYFPGGAVD